MKNETGYLFLILLVSAILGFLGGVVIGIVLFILLATVLAWSQSRVRTGKIAKPKPWNYNDPIISKHNVIGDLLSYAVLVAVPLAIFGLCYLTHWLNQPYPNAIYTNYLGR
jgi:multisubunit Na+/H+ antiporter MnhB subunit